MMQKAMEVKQRERVSYSKHVTKDMREILLEFDVVVLFFLLAYSRRDFEWNLFVFVAYMYWLDIYLFFRSFCGGGF